MDQASPAVETMRWTGEALELLDQRLLPARIVYSSCRDAAETAQAIRDMVVRGAPAIGCAAAFGVALEARRALRLPADQARERIEAGIRVLAGSRPTAVNLFWALERMREVLRRSAGESAALVAALEQAAVRVYDEDIEVNRAMGRAGEPLVPDGACVMTHCNAGALATAGHGTALGVIRSARDAGKRVSVIANETRPYLQGARLTAWEMVQEKIPVTLITDNMAGYVMRLGKVDLVIVGADRIAANGDVANKIGTFSVAVLARRHNIPFYVAAPLSTIDVAIADGSAIPIEERSADEVTGYGDTRWAPEGVKVFNPAFDVTPAELVSGIITERGVVLRPDAQGIHRLFA